MSGVQLELDNPNTYESPKDYVEKHLAPLVTELHRITNELLSPGSSSPEAWEVDMTPSDQTCLHFSDLNRRLDDLPKSVVFDGSAYQHISKELLRSKQLKVLLTATVYVKHNAFDVGGAAFRLVRDDGAIVLNSLMETFAKEPATMSCHLPFGDSANCVAPKEHRYMLQGKGLGLGSIPVCRRFAMSFVYI